jgi:outer membrane protein assembly factor BamB
VVFVGFSDGSLVALNAKNGSPLWEQQISRALRFRDVDSEILVEGNLVYSLNFGEGAYAFRARTGERVWHHEVGGFGGFLNLGDELCYSSVSSEVVCVEKLSGRLKRQMGGLLGVGTTPIIAGKHWLVGESLGSLLFIRPSDLKIERRFDPGRGISSKPFFDVETNTVFFMSNEGNLYGLRLAEGLKAKEDVKR